MAKVTSSSNRSKRSTNKPVTKGQNPQRANRQGVSQAKVTSASNGKPTGTAASRVTMGRGGMGKPVGRGIGPAAVAMETLKARPTAKGTLKGGGAVGPTMPKRLEQQGLAAQERKARLALTARKKAAGSAQATPNTAASFDDAFKDARRAKVKAFTWRGKKYTTEMK